MIWFNIFSFAMLLLQQRHGWKTLVSCIIDIIIRIWNTHSLFVFVLCKYYNSVIAYYRDKAIAISSSLRFYSQSITGNSYVNRETCSRNHLEVKTFPSWKNFFLVPLLWQDEKTSFLILYRAQNLPSLLFLSKKTFHLTIDIADPSSMQDACHLTS